MIALGLDLMDVVDTVIRLASCHAIVSVMASLAFSWYVYEIINEVM